MIYHYCPSIVTECGCSNVNQEVLEDSENYILKLGGHVSMCSDQKGYVYLVSSCCRSNGKMNDSDQDKNIIAFDPSCETFKLIKNKNSYQSKIGKERPKALLNENSAANAIISGAMVFITEYDAKTISAKYLIRFGGWKFPSHNDLIKVPNISKGIYSCVYCLYDLQEYHESTDRFNVLTQRGAGAVNSSSYKSGHSKIVTELVSLDESPMFNADWDVYNLQDTCWLDDEMRDQNASYSIQKSSLPFCVGDAATIVMGQNLYVIGGYKIEHDKDWTQNLLYQVNLNII